MEATTSLSLATHVVVHKLARTVRLIHACTYTYLHIRIHVFAFVHACVHACTFDPSAVSSSWRNTSLGVADCGVCPCQLRWYIVASRTLQKGFAHIHPAYIAGEIAGRTGLMPRGSVHQLAHRVRCSRSFFAVQEVCAFEIWPDLFFLGLISTRSML